MSIPESEFRAALSLWPSGVAVVTAAHDGILHGMTVSSFSSVSLSPPLVSVCLDRETKTLPLIERSARFAINVLSRDQAAISGHFASKRTEEDRLGGQRYSLGPSGCPLLHGALVQLECEVFASYPGGDHVIVVGQVTATERAVGEPLLYFNGGYRSLAP